MAFTVSYLWKAPEINPLNHKARSIPALNVINVYGRVFFFSWFGFLIAFWSWYAFPPLMSITIRKDLKLTQNDVSNSNILALTATLLVRLVAGPACDRFGPRKTFAGCLLLGAIPTALAGLVTNARGLMALRFFIGILGGSFVPCQVWTTAFYDKNVVGTANALTGGLGNSGGGITYFVMPAIYDSLVNGRGLTPGQAWRVSFIVPFILITSTAILMLLLCPDTPNGKWSDRHLVGPHAGGPHQTDGQVVDVPGSIMDRKEGSAGTNSPTVSDEKLKLDGKGGATYDNEAQIGDQQLIEEAKGEVVVKPTVRETIRVMLSPQTLVLGMGYFNSFGAELAINSILGAYYLKNFPYLGQTRSGNLAAIFGLLNVFTRPAGGFISDIIYHYTHSVWAKKMWIHALGFTTGGFLIVIGLLDSKKEATMLGLVAGMAFFLEAGNGANFSLVPHVHPKANGIVSGLTGAMGNFGGVIFAIIFRYNGTHYGRVFWIAGIISIAMNLSVSWIRPIPRGQIGGR